MTFVITRGVDMGSINLRIDDELKARSYAALKKWV